MSSESAALSPTTPPPHASGGTAGNPKPGDAQWKDNNPKAAFGAAKVGIDYLSLPVLFEQAIGMMAGGYKYGAHNYLEAPPSVMTYVAALFRHVGAFVGGEEFDPHAGEGVQVHHLVAGMNCLHVIRAAMIHGKFVDDRPPKMPPGFIDSLSASVVALQRNNPDPVARYLADGKRGPGRIIGETPPAPRRLSPAEEAALFPSHDQVSRERDALEDRTHPEALDARVRLCCDTDPRIEGHSPLCTFGK